MCLFQDFEFYFGLVHFVFEQSDILWLFDFHQIIEKAFIIIRLVLLFVLDLFLQLEDGELGETDLFQDLVDSVFYLQFVGLNDVSVYKIKKLNWTVHSTEPRQDGDQKSPYSG